MTGRRRGLSCQERVDLWRRWKSGQSISEIGRALGKPPGSVHGYLSKRGGIAPPSRERSERSLSLDEREDISRGLAAGLSLREIARMLQRSPSTVSREVARNGGREKYRATSADKRAWAKAKRPKECKLAMAPRLQSLVAEKLQEDWSPEQISGWLRRTFPGDRSMHVSHETIYRSLFVQARGVLRKKLLAHLRSGRKFRRSRAATTAGQNRGQIIDAVSIRERPPEVEDRAIPGHWEGDLITGSGNSHIATLVERKSRFTKLVKVQGKDAVSVETALVREVQKLPQALMSSLTWDRGPEMARHRSFTVATDVDVYFCDPSSPWQRGTNENTNRLLRQYFPKGTDLSRYRQDELDAVALRLNQRPRKILGFLSPGEKLAQLLP